MQDYTVAFAQSLVTTQPTTAPITLPPTLFNSYIIVAAAASSVIQSAISRQFATNIILSSPNHVTRSRDMNVPPTVRLSVGQVRLTVRW